MIRLALGVGLVLGGSCWAGFWWLGAQFVRANGVPFGEFYRMAVWGIPPVVAGVMVLTTR